MLQQGRLHLEASKSSAYMHRAKSSSRNTGQERRTSELRLEIHSSKQHCFYC